jgi:hypothetical protein
MRATAWISSWSHTSVPSRAFQCPKSPISKRMPQSDVPIHCTRSVSWKSRESNVQRLKAPVRASNWALGHGFPELLRIMGVAPRAQHVFDPEPPPHCVGAARDDIVDHPQAKSIEPLIADRVGEERDGKLAAACLGAHRCKELIQRHTREGRSSSGARPGGLGVIEAARAASAEKTTERRSGGDRFRFNTPEQGGFVGGQEKCELGFGEHP